MLLLQNVKIISDQVTYSTCTLNVASVLTLYTYFSKSRLVTRYIYSVICFIYINLIFLTKQ